MVFGEKRINTLISYLRQIIVVQLILVSLSAHLEKLKLCLTGFRLKNLKVQDLFVFYAEI